MIGNLPLSGKLDFGADQYRGPDTLTATLRATLGESQPLALPVLSALVPYLPRPGLEHDDPRRRTAGGPGQRGLAGPAAVDERAVARPVRRGHGDDRRAGQPERGGHVPVAARPGGPPAVQPADGRVLGQPSPAPQQGPAGRRGVDARQLRGLHGRGRDGGLPDRAGGSAPHPDRGRGPLLPAPVRQPGPVPESPRPSGFGSGLRAKTHSSTGCPSTRCCCTNSGMRSAVMPVYHVPSG